MVSSLRVSRRAGRLPLALLLALAFAVAVPAQNDGALGTGTGTGAGSGPPQIPRSAPVATATPGQGFVVFEALPQGSGAEGLSTLAENLRIRPGEMVLIGDVGGHVVRPDGRGGIEAPTLTEGPLPEVVREGRLIVYDHHHAAGKVSGAGGYANAGHMIYDHRDRLVEHVK